MPKHYRITATLTHPEKEFHASRHILLGEVNEETLTGGAWEKLLEEAASQCLRSRNLLLDPLLANFETAEIMLFGRIPKGDPEGVQGGAKVWYRVEHK